MKKKRKSADQTKDMHWVTVGLHPLMLDEMRCTKGELITRMVGSLLLLECLVGYSSLRVAVASVEGLIAGAKKHPHVLLQETAGGPLKEIKLKNAAMAYLRSLGPPKTS
jgi:hypothetical protein